MTRLLRLQLRVFDISRLCVLLDPLMRTDEMYLDEEEARRHV